MGDVNAIGHQILMLGRLAYLQGDLSAAAALHEEGLPLLRQIGEWQRVGWGLQVQAKILRDTGAYEQATTYLEEALGLFRKDREPTGSAAMLADLGCIDWLAGDDSSAVNLLRQALAEVTNRHGRACVLGVLACVLVTQGHVEQAVRFLATAERERDAMGLVLEPVERAWIERALAATCSAMEAAAWDTAWAVGQAMALEQAIAHALAGSS
jgi:tetratricopeptide (TPR) repeat protein